ncbi:ESX secretion-associated protein EspG [Nocardia carnea]|uniref:ESX secretion-associated protein EspG n=1 Tax=Nocardia carnea TaxID=37328 RepID=UPI002455DC88|nr:ESX secretion-associated protein EspG [Nocardia carnea]
MSRTWTFTDVEFVAAWEATKEGYLPEPFVYTSEPGRHHDHRRKVIEAAERVRSLFGPELAEIMTGVAAPDIRVVVRGFDGQDFQNAERSVRLLGTRKGDNAYLVIQEPGRTLWHAAGFTMSEHEAVGLADAVVAELPEVQPGRRADFVLPSGPAGNGLERPVKRSSVLHRDDDPTAFGRSFGDAPADLAGTITVVQGFSRFGPRGIRRLGLRWRDITGDGRYLIVPGNPSTVLSVDRKRMVGVINRQIAEVVRTIKEERANLGS